MNLETSMPFFRSNPVKLFATVLSAVLVMVATLPSHAADWKPTRAVTLLVPYSPGGGVDAQARAVAEQLQQIWGQPVIVENAPGADGVIGTRKAMSAAPDGHTLLVQLPSITIMRHLPTYKGPDPLSQLTPISAFSLLPAVVVANPALPGKTLPDVLKGCKTAKPGCTFGTTEIMARLLSGVLKEESALPDLVVANYKGGGQIVADLIANNVNFAIMGMTPVLPHHKVGKLKIVMTLGNKRSSAVPEVPNAVESGLPSFNIGTWYGLFAPKGTPADVVQGISAAVAHAVRSDGVRKAFGAVAADPLGNSPAEFAEMVKAENDRYAGLAKRFPIEQ
jgi:tripartite-type tricarboxylate transporter receptor subunit TctC